VRPGTPLVLASCNGAAHALDAGEWIGAFDSRSLLAGTPWADHRLPVVSSSCASGLHALCLAARTLTAKHDEAVVLAVEILSPASHENFEALRVLATDLEIPWQATNTGFLPGEAAVAVRVARARSGQDLMAAVDLVMGQDMIQGDCLRALVAAFGAETPSVVLGQGTGPAGVDQIELSAIDGTVDQDIPITTPQLHFGHSLGASGLLSLSLGALAIGRGELPPALGMPRATTCTGRPLASGKPRLPLTGALVVCRALSGACVVSRIGRPRAGTPSALPARFRPGPLPPPPPEASGHAVLRRIVAEAAGARPAAPPNLLLVRVDAPLVPSPRGSLGKRLLPHGVLAITPGFLPSLIARLWGYHGPALCLVGGNGEDGYEEFSGVNRTDATVAEVRLRGTGYEREVEWNVEPG
jgi:hypothetical protein